MSDCSANQAGKDPLIDEIRAIRRSISLRFDNDVDRLCDHLQELEKQHPEWTIAPEPGMAPAALRGLEPDPQTRAIGK